MTVRRALSFGLSFLSGIAAFAAVAWLVDPALRPTRLSPADEAAIRSVLVDYQRIYEDFFASGGVPALLDEFPASKDVKHHVFRDLGFVRDAGLVLVQDLARMEVREVRATGEGLAEAVTFEEWNYVFELSGDRRPASKLKGMGQGFTYRLRRTSGAWKVVGWDLADVAPPPSDEARKW